MRVIETRKITAVLLSASKNLKTGMLSDFYDTISFKLGKVIDYIELYILIQVYLTMTLIESHKNARKQ